MACASQAMVSANMLTMSTTSSAKSFRMFNISKLGYKPINANSFTVKASSEDDTDCNDAECAPEKEVGKVSMEWVAEEKTQVIGTYPPRNRRPWTGYVEKDTAGQTNIYSVEPAVYVAESGISSGTAGSSSEGSENTLAIVAAVALIAVAAASSVLFQVGKNSPNVQTVGYNGPSLSYYINKFKPPEIVEAAVPSNAESSAPVLAESSAVEAPQIQIQSEYQPEPSTSSVS